MMNRIISILTLFVFALAVQAQTGKVTIQQIANATAQMRSLTCDFVQTKRMKMMKDEAISTGRMAYERPEHLRWEYSTPKELVFVMNDGKAYIKKDGRKTLLDAARGKAFRKISTLIMGCVTGQGLTDEKTFTSSLETDRDRCIVTMTPRQKDMQRMYSRIVLHYNAKAQVVEKVEMHEKRGDVTIIEMKNIQTNARILKGTF